MSVRPYPRLHVSTLFYCPGEYYLHRWSIQFGSSHPNNGSCPRHWNSRKFFFLSKHPLKLLGLEDRAKKHNISGVMKHNLILQGALPPACMEEKLHGKLRSFPPSNHPDILCSTWPTCISSFLVPSSFRNSQDEIYFKGGRLWHPVSSKH
jgi:hypothetical protein